MSQCTDIPISLNNQLQWHCQLLRNGKVRTNSELEKLIDSIKTRSSTDKWLEETLSHLTYLFEEDKDILYIGFRNLYRDIENEYQNHSKILSIIFEILKLIVEDMTEEVRLNNFHAIVETYYLMLKEKLQSVNVDLTKISSPSNYENFIKLLNPFVKLIVIRDSMQCKKDNCEQQRVLVSEVKEYFKCPNLLKEDCYKILQSKLKCRGAHIWEFSLDPRQYMGFIGEYFKLKIYYEFKCEKHVVEMFTKSFINNSQAFGDMAAASFRKEEFFYKIFVSRLYEFGYGNILTFLPECYFVRYNDILVLEDLSLAGYKSIDHQTRIKYKELSVITKRLAQMHACSILFEEKQCKIKNRTYRLNEEYAEYLTDIHYSKEKCGEINRCGIRSVYQIILPKFPDVPKKISLETFIKKTQYLCNGVLEKFDCSYKYRSVICHADTWLGNVMFREVEDEISCKIIDFQLIKYCPPALELWCLLYINTTKEIRDACSNMIFNEYYEELGNFLNGFNVNIKDIYPKEVFFESCENLKITALCHSLSYTATLSCPKSVMHDASQDFDKFNRFLKEDRTEVYNQAFQDKSYRIRLRHLVEELCQYCEKDSNEI